MEDSTFGNPSSNDALVERSSRKIESLKSSLSFRLGNLLVESVLRPWKIIILPFSLVRLFWRFGQERIGMRAIESQQEINLPFESRNCAVLFPTNGVGMGHYARMFALAMAMKRRDPDIEIVFFTTNYVLHPLYAEGMTSYHLPNRQKFKGMGAKVWNSQCEEMLANIFSVHKPSIFVFDGSYPYRGMLNAIKSREGTKKAWIRRIVKRGKDSVPSDSFSHFDRIVVPGDMMEPDMEELAKWPVEEINLTSPILSVPRNDLHPRGLLRGKLGIPDNATLALVSLGAGEINDIGNLRRFVTEYLVEKGVYVVIADSMLKPMSDSSFVSNEKIRIVQSFPIMRSRNCFDFAIIAGGYNSVNECILLRLPSVIIPNYETQRDDQPMRAMKAAERGGAILVEEPDRGIISLALDRINDPGVRSQMAERLIVNVSDDGAESLAKSLLSD